MKQKSGMMKLSSRSPMALGELRKKCGELSLKRELPRSLCERGLLSLAPARIEKGRSTQSSFLDRGDTGRDGASLMLCVPSFTKGKRRGKTSASPRLKKLSRGKRGETIRRGIYHKIRRNQGQLRQPVAPLA